MLLSQLFAGQSDVEISGISIDSRKVKKGDLFFCIEGLETDGHKYAESAVKAGAVAVVITKDIKKEQGIAYIKVNNANDELNRVCNTFFGQPSRKMKVFGVTGTNGKTTTTSIIQDIYGKFTPCGYIGTIAIRYGDVSKVVGLTTPDAVEIHSSLNEMVTHGMGAVAMEVSSHGLALGRVDSVDFDYGIFTNLTYDHLDYHKTMEAYFDAKKLLFTNMKKDGVAILNTDDMSYEELRKSSPCRVVTYGVENQADYMAEEVKLSTTGTKFILNNNGQKYEMETNLVALYNIYNLLAAVAAIHQDGIKIEDMIPYMKTISQVDGRMEIIDEGQDFNVIVDYAHTPDGYDKLFQYVKDVLDSEGKIYTVFGCSGKRDKVKRKVLGGISGKYSETVILTEEDPRDEKPADIAKEIMAGMKDGNGIFVEDRFQAIKTAISMAKKGDCVLILGKGDETYMCYGESKSPWMGDNKAAEEILKSGMCNG